MTRCILLVDGDRSTRELFSSLESPECQIDTVKLGKKAIKMTQRTKYDLICHDLKTPGINGLEKLRRLQNVNKNTPVYIITAFHQESFNQLIRAKEEGLDFELLFKPLDSKLLNLIINSILNGVRKYLE